MLPIEVHEITLTRWDRPVAGTPISLASDVAIRVLTPRIGPTGTLFLYRFAAHDVTTERTTYQTLAAELGVAPAVMVRTIERVIRFGYARWADTDCRLLEVPTQLGSGTSTGGGTPTARPVPDLRAA